jgi:hypothetical protein
MKKLLLIFLLSLFSVSAAFASVNFDIQAEDDLSSDRQQVYTDYLEAEAKRLKSEYGFDLWWSNKNKMTVRFVDLREGLFGFYDPVKNELIVDVFNEEDRVKTTISHELFHAVRDSYMPGYLFADDFTEGMAVMMQYKAPNLKDLMHVDLEGGVSALSDPAKSVFANDDSTYSTFLWCSFLDSQYGDSFLESVLGEYAKFEGEIARYKHCNPQICTGANPANHHYYTYNAVNSALETKGSNIIEAYKDFAIQNYDAGDYVDGEAFNGVELVKTHDKRRATTVISSAAPI